MGRPKKVIQEPIIEQPKDEVKMEQVTEEAKVEKKDVVRSKLDKIAALREKRELGLPDTKLQRDIEIEGYTLAYFNDTNDRINNKLREGWEFVKKSEVPNLGNVDNDVSDRISRYAGKDETDKPYRTYLMKIENEVYIELMKLNNTAAESAMRTIHQTKDGQYVPQSHGISITRK